MCSSHTTQWDTDIRSEPKLDGQIIAEFLKDTVLQNTGMIPGFCRGFLISPNVIFLIELKKRKKLVKHQVHIFAFVCEPISAKCWSGRTLSAVDSLNGPPMFAEFADFFPWVLDYCVSVPEGFHMASHHLHFELDSIAVQLPSNHRRLKSLERALEIGMEFTSNGQMCVSVQVMFKKFNRCV